MLFNCYEATVNSNDHWFSWKPDIWNECYGVWLYSCICVYMGLYMFMYICICICLCVYVYVYVYVYIYIYIYINLYIYIYIYMYIFIPSYFEHNLHWKIKVISNHDLLNNKCMWKIRCNHVHNIFVLFDSWANFPFMASEKKPDYY